MTDPYTTDRFRCLDCKHRGPALKDTTEQHHGDGAVETVYEPICEKCGSPHVREVDEG